MCQVCQHGHRTEFSIPDEVKHVLNQPSTERQVAHDHIRHGNLADAEAALRDACTQPLRAVEYGRTLVDLARIVDNSKQALAYLGRAEVLLTQDEHQIVTDDERRLMADLKYQLAQPTIKLATLATRMTYSNLPAA